jgi:erythromycin esterase-like protein
MTVDPSDPETFEVEETTAIADHSTEAPEADTAEQQTDLAPRLDDSLEEANTDAANEADVAEQARVVSLDEDDYR